MTPSPVTHHCVACREPLHPEARVCPHCRSPQTRAKWQVVGSALKWVGGITAVLSLVIAAARLNELYTGWQERGVAVEELVRAAHLQLDSHAYEGGWQLLQQALELDPVSRTARELQIPFALAWLRNIRVHGDQTFTGVVDRLLPVLYRGAGDPDPIVAADVLAHIGWANYFKHREGNRSVEIDALHARALALDPGNPFAHVHWGHWVLYNGNNGDYGEDPVYKARRHFSAALRSGREPDYVSNLALAALLSSRKAGTESEALRLANALRISGKRLDAQRLSLLHVRFDLISRVGEEQAAKRITVLSGILPPGELAALFTWLVEGMPARGLMQPSEKPENRFVLGRLYEAAGETQKARAIYTALRDDPEARETLLKFRVAPAIARLNAAADRP